MDEEPFNAFEAALDMPLKENKPVQKQWYKDQTRVITTNYILSELVALFISPLRIPRPKQIQAIETIKTEALAKRLDDSNNTMQCVNLPAQMSDWQLSCVLFLCFDFFPDTSDALGVEIPLPLLEH